MVILLDATYHQRCKPIAHNHKWLVITIFMFVLTGIRAQANKFCVCMVEPFELKMKINLEIWDVLEQCSGSQRRKLGGPLF